MKIAMVLLVLVFAGSAQAFTPTGGDYGIKKVVSEVIAPPNSTCGVVPATTMAVTNASASGYDVVPTYNFPWGETFVGESFHCNLLGHHASCGTKKTFEMDMSTEGYNAILYFKFSTGEKHQWTADAKFLTSSAGQIYCKGPDCDKVFGPRPHSCTSQTVVEYGTP